ncbi:MAG: hypothetical protein WCJ03_04430 [Bacteroidales bacterium]
MIKKIKLLLGFVLFFVGYVLASDNIPIDKYNGGMSYNNISDFLSQRKTLYYIGYGRNNFLNDNYRYGIMDGTLEGGGTLEFGERFYFRKPIFLDIGGFWGGYSSTSLKDISHFGLKSAISYVIMPTMKIFIPYLGVGYQYSYLIQLAKDNKSDNGPAISTSVPFWKCGIQSFLGDSFSLNFEYSQSFGNVEKASDQIFFGISFYIK